MSHQFLSNGHRQELEQEPLGPLAFLLQVHGLVPELQREGLHLLDDLVDEDHDHGRHYQRYDEFKDADDERLFQVLVLTVCGLEGKGQTVFVYM